MLSPKEFKKSLLLGSKTSKQKSRSLNQSLSSGDQILYDVYKQLYSQISNLVDGGGIDFSNVDLLIKASMEAVDFVSSTKNPPLDGMAKAEIAKKLIIRVLQDLTSKGKIPKDIGDKVVMAIEVIGPVMFKLIVMATKGQFDLNHLLNIDVTSCGCFGK